MSLPLLAKRILHDPAALCNIAVHSWTRKEISQEVASSYVLEFVSCNVHRSFQLLHGEMWLQEGLEGFIPATFLPQCTGHFHHLGPAHVVFWRISSPLTANLKCDFFAANPAMNSHLSETTDLT